MPLFPSIPECPAHSAAELAMAVQPSSGISGLKGHFSVLPKKAGRVPRGLAGEVGESTAGQTPLGLLSS